MNENNNMLVNQTSQKKKFPTWAWWVVGIVSGIILIGIGYLVASNQYRTENQSLQNQIDELQNQKSTDTSTSQKTETSDPTADWETFTSEEAGYSIKYPSDWAKDIFFEGENCTKQYYQGNGTGVGLFSPIAQEEAKTLCEEQREGCTSDITIEYFDNKEDLYNMYRDRSDESLDYQYDMDLREWVGDAMDLGYNKVYSQIKDITINGYPAIEAEESFTVTATHCDPAYVIFMEKDGHYYTIRRSMGDTSKSLTETDELVINSFEFIN